MGVFTRKEENLAWNKMTNSSEDGTEGSNHVAFV